MPEHAFLEHENGGMGNLPVETTSFVGRRDELAEAEQLLAGNRLLTLSGPGGVGKTRVAVHLAHRVRDAYPHGVCFVPLAALSDESLLPQLVATELGLTESTTDADLLDFLSDKSLLLILDCCEHLVRACRSLVGEILTAAPRVRVITTSRFVLSMDGEQLLRLRPLPVHASDGPGDAVILLTERAGAAVRGFTVDDRTLDTLARICQYLDGIPLGIELASSWLRLLSPDELRDELVAQHKLAPDIAVYGLDRHRLDETTVGWSYRLCSPDEQLLWARSAVFPSGFTIDAAIAVCTGGRIGRTRLPDLLDQLVDKSVLTFDLRDGAPRYRALATIRQWGTAMLRKSGEEQEVRRRYCDYFLGYTERFAQAWPGPSQLELIAATRREHDNLSAALAYDLRAPGDPPTGAAIALGLFQYWVSSGLLTEYRHWLRQFLSAEGLSAYLRVGMLCAQVHIAVMLEDADEADSSSRAALTAAAGSGVPGLISASFLAAGFAAQSRSDLAEAKTYFKACADASRGIENDVPTQLVLLLGQSLTATLDNAAGDGAALARQAIDLADTVGEKWVRTYSLYALGLAEWRLERLGEAKATLREGLTRSLEFANVPCAAGFAEVLAWIYCSAGDPTGSATLLGAADTMWRTMGNGTLVGLGFLGAERTACVQANRRALGVGGYRDAFQRGVTNSQNLRNMVDFVLTLTSDTIPAPLTARQTQVVELIARGESNEAIASRMGIAPRTVRHHVEKIFQVLGLTSRAQVAAWFVRHTRADRGSAP